MKKNLLLSLAIMLSGSAMAQSKMNAFSKMTLEGMRTDKATYAKKMVKASSTGEDAVSAFITVKNPSALEELRQMGVELGYNNGHVTTATIPMSVIDDVLAMDDVTNFDISMTMNKCTDAVRHFTNVYQVHRGNELDRPYQGKGVIFGSVDGGIDFQHAAFKDMNGNSRILKAYLPDAKNKLPGAQENYPVTIGDYSTTLKGYVYDSNNLSGLTTGDKSDYHGTHVANIGAGSPYGSIRFYGMAPEASLIFVDAAEIGQTTIVDGVALIFSEAEKLGMPAVVNISLSSNIGPHVMTPFNELLSSLTGPGRIICFGAGNEGDKNMWLHKAAGETLRTRAISTLTNDANIPNGVVDIWGKDGKPYTFKVCARDKRTNELNVLYNSDTDAEHKIIISLKYLKMGTIIAGKDFDKDDKNFNGGFQCLGVKMRDNYELVLEVSGESEADLSSSSGLISFAGEEGTDYVTGSPDCSFNTAACFDNAISVGSYNTKDGFTWVGDGSWHQRADLFPIGEVSFYSSYGTDREGRTFPTVIAPGAMVMSAGNFYCDQCKLSDSYEDLLVQYDQKDGRIQPYMACFGTSMATPVVSGIVALMLEQNPALTPQDVKNIFAMTCTKDELIINDEKRIGYGKVDALAALQNLPTEIIHKVTGNEPMIMAAHNGFSVLSPKSDAKVEVFNAAGQCVMTTMAKGGTTQSYSIDGSGMYIVKVGATVKKVTL